MAKVEYPKKLLLRKTLRRERPNGEWKAPF